MSSMVRDTICTNFKRNYLELSRKICITCSNEAMASLQQTHGEKCERKELAAELKHDRTTAKTTSLLQLLFTFSICASAESQKS